MANATFAFHQSLTTLQLAHNRLTTIPDSIAQLTALLVLDLSYNQISVIPASIITALHATLESLNFAHNSIVEVPVELATLTRLTTLQLDSNRVVKFPGAILRDTRVVTVSLAGNPITTRQFMAVDGYDQVGCVMCVQLRIPS